MSSLKLPNLLKPFVFAKKNLSFVDEFDLINFDIDAVHSGNVVLDLEFSLKDKVAIACGKLQLSAVLNCVNCLENVDFKLEKNLNIAFVSDDCKTDDLIDYEIIDCNFEDVIQTSDFITEEVLLALPMFAKHNHNCITIDTEDNTCEKDLKNNPFAVLKELKNI